MTKRICIVPARKGSKRLPNKNFKNLNGKPLIMHTVDVVAKYFDAVLVTTNDEEFLDKMRQENEYYNVSFYLRPPHLCTDTSKVIDTVCHYFDEIELLRYDQIWLALPTCPLRTEGDVINAINILEPLGKLTNSGKYIPELVPPEGVISITDYEFPPALGLTNNYYIRDWHESRPWQNNNTRSQDHNVVFRPNGALYGMWTKYFYVYRNFYKSRYMTGYYMPRERSVDIDTKLDFKLAELLLKERENG